MGTRALKIVMIIVLVAMTVGCDQATKHIARTQLDGRGSIFLAGGVFVLHYVENEGGFLSLGARLPQPLKTLALVAFPLLVLGFMIAFMARRGLGNMILLAGFAFIVGGGVGNLIDRLTRSGRVSDFMILRSPWVSSGIFNLADLAVLAGCLLILISSLKEGRGRHPPARTETPAP